MEKTALLFSGGKDSLACLYLAREQWDELDVVWLNTGAADEETLEYMARWRDRLPRFFEIRTDQPGDLRENGWPADVVPVNSTRFGKMIAGDDGSPLIQSYLNCCANNIWIPLHQWLVDNGYTRAITGQRAADARKSIATHGTIANGVTYLMPIEGWSDDQVWSYLREVGADLAPGYARGELTGRDCWDCTAYLRENAKRIANLPQDKWREVERRIQAIEDAVTAQWGW